MPNPSPATHSFARLRQPAEEQTPRSESSTPSTRFCAARPFVSESHDRGGPRREAGVTDRNHLSAFPPTPGKICLAAAFAARAPRTFIPRTDSQVETLEQILELTRAPAYETLDWPTRASGAAIISGARRPWKCASRPAEIPPRHAQAAHYAGPACGRAGGAGGRRWWMATHVLSSARAGRILPRHIAGSAGQEAERSRGGAPIELISRRRSPAGPPGRRLRPDPGGPFRPSQTRDPALPSATHLDSLFT